jgi:hypothetical protein
MKIVRVIAAIALAFLSITAIWGAVLLMQDPMGRPMDIPVSVLRHSPFHSFFIPGIILLVSNGLLPCAFSVATAFCRRGYGRWIAFQGCVLFGWITIEVMMLREVVWLHFLYWGIALLLIACGWALHRHERTAQALALHAVSAVRR